MDLYQTLVENNALNIVTDTREPFPEGAAFFALQGPNYDGSLFIEDARRQGARFLVSSKEVPSSPSCEAICVADTRTALQDLASEHRRRTPIPLLAITGSNGKTLLKDFLALILSETKGLFCSPGSYNSFIGIAKSLLMIKPGNALGVIEVGVSASGEMGEKAKMVKPNYGVLTNIGLAHFEGFGSRRAIAKEKMELFKDIPEDGWVLLPDEPLLKNAAQQLKCKVFIVGRDERLPRLESVQHLQTGKSVLFIQYPDGSHYEVIVPIDGAFPEVCETLFMGMCIAHLFGVTPAVVVGAAKRYRPPQDRMEIWKSERGHLLVNDAYSSDPVSAHACLQVFKDYPSARKIFVFGGMPELGSQKDYEHRIVAEEVSRLNVDILLTVGTLGKLTHQTFKSLKPNGVAFHYDGIEPLLVASEDLIRPGDVIVIKGPHKLKLDQIATRFKAHLSKTAYYIDLGRLEYNIKTWRDHLKPGTRLLVMIKALAYGSDAIQIASFLQQHVDQFGVAYIKEAVTLRQHGIRKDILVQLVMEEDVDEVVRLDLQPVVFDLKIVKVLSEAAVRAGRVLRVHLEVDTGMGRFGADPSRVLELAQAIDGLPGLTLYGLMTHFSSADDSQSDPFSLEQMRTFEKIQEQLKSCGLSPEVCHAAATAAAARFSDSHYDMVRIGLGIYGVYPADCVSEAIRLKCPLALVSKVASIKEYPEGHPISYNRRYITTRKSRIAYLPIGYHDGLARRWGDGWSVIIDGKKAPIVGAVCMDFTPVDVTDLPEVTVGGEALIFGEWHGQRNPIEKLAALEGTIPYEILCRLSERIQRIYLRNRY